jgi:hypothetical protein
MLFAWPAQFSPTIKEVDRLERDRGTIMVFCDAPRGNVVYVAVPNEGFTRPPAIAVIHQPEACK